ncbi:MAG: DUF853 domain-containing protein [Clostridia bacterium]|nr:DUF853 domain-containing protein [Clostridia bacterium]
MYKDGKIVIGLTEDGKEVTLLPKMMNRHGLITGATGTGKTTTLKTLAEDLSQMGVPVFFSDVKGDLAGLAKEFPVTFWDIFAEKGIQLRTTVSEMGPVLLSKLMDLSDTQSSVLQVIFKIADDKGILLIDTKDLKAMLNHALENNDEYSKIYGNIPQVTATTIIRDIVALEAKGGDRFFFEPALSIADWFRTDENGRGMINILDCQSLISDSTMYATFLIWMFSELFEVLPEVGDLDKPRMVFFFDEAHVIFRDMSKVLRDKFVQVAKLIRSKGVGVYFISQTPKDIPSDVLQQLNNKIQHGLRAYTPNDEKLVKTVADTFRVNPEFDTYKTLINLGTGEALVSTLSEDGVPTVVEKVKVCAPLTMDMKMTDDERQKAILINNLYLKYRDPVDNPSAYEYFMRVEEAESLKEEVPKEKKSSVTKNDSKSSVSKEEYEKKKAVKRVTSSAAGTIGRQVGRSIGKNFGSFGKTLGGNVGAELARTIIGNLIK